MIFRTPTQKADLKWMWERGDRAFFAAGACHVLAHEFLQTEAGRGFYPFMIVPEPGFRGSHVIATNGRIVFDYHGISFHEAYEQHFKRKIVRFFPDWRGQFIEAGDNFWTDAWFAAHQLRRPDQFYRNPTERARRFIALFVKSLRPVKGMMVRGEDRFSFNQLVTPPGRVLTSETLDT
jgi:hypothetical protein